MLLSVLRLLLTNWFVLASVLPAMAGLRTDAVGDALPSGARARLGTTRFRVTPGSDVRVGALSPDGKTFAVAKGQTALSMLDTITGKEVRQLSMNPFGVSGIAFAPDGKVLAVGNFQGLTVYDALSGASLANFAKRHLDAQGGMLSFSADGQRLAIGHYHSGQKSSVIIWDVRKKKELTNLDALHNQIVYVALSSDGKTLATWGMDNKVRGGAGGRTHNNIVQLWDVDKGEETRQVAVDSIAVAAATLSPDGKQVAILEGSGSAVSIHEAATGKQLRRLATHSQTRKLLRYSPDGKRLLACTNEGIVQVWDARSGKRLACFRGPKCQPLSAEFLSGGKVLAAGISNQTVHLWEIPEGRRRGGDDGPTAAVSTLVFSRDGKTLISAGADGVRLWETATGKALRFDPYRENPQRFNILTYLLSPDGQLLLQSNPNRMVRVLQRDSGEEICMLDGTIPFGPNYRPGAFAEDGVTFLTLGGVYTERKPQTAVRVWDLRAMQEIRCFKMDHLDANTSSLALSANGKTIALGAGLPTRGANPPKQEVRLISAISGKEIGKFSPPDWISALAFSPDGSRLAGGGMQKPIRVWDAATGKELRVLEGQLPGTVSKVVFSPDGRALAAAVNARGNQGSGKILLWETLTGKLRAEFIGHRDTVNALAFAPDSRTLASGSADTSILLWDATGQSEDAVRTAAPPTEKEREQLWSDLNHKDGKRAFRAMGRLSTTPAETVAQLRKHVAPDRSEKPSEAEIEKRIASLDSEEFATREKAMREFTNAGKAMMPYLTKALEAKPGLEKRRRLEQLVKTLRSADPPPRLLRPLRAVELLEQLNTAEARELLAALAGGNPDSLLTREAKTALRRLARK